MIYKITIFYLCLLLTVCCKAQTDAQKDIPDGSGKTGAFPIASAGNDSALTGAAPLAKTLRDVLFATNEDCRLFINEVAKGVISKNRFLYLKLSPGTYRYIAKSLATGDEWRDTFSITEGRTNEVFIDMLYTMDIAEEIRAKAEPKSTAPLTASAKNRKIPSANMKVQKQTATKEPEQATINFIVSNMVPVEGGTFVMGNNKSPSVNEAEHPVLLNSFFMSKYEVTQEQWEKIMGYNPSIHKGCSACPVENVSWEEVMVFLRKINSVSNKEFRLPTEAEWEYVAKLGGKAEIDRAGGTEAFIKKSAWAFINSENKTHPVGKKQPNVSGIYDLIGNVSEWCMDWYGAFFYKEDFTEKDPEGPPLGKDKVIRGGNYKDYSGDRFRPSFRNKMNPKSKGSDIGFRLVMEWQD